MADDRFSFVEGAYRSAAGTYQVSWERKENEICYHLEVPFDAQAEFILEKGVAATVNGEISSRLEKEGSILEYTVDTKRVQKEGEKK